MANEEKAYPISAWPEEERPRERLLRYGASSLSNAELLAIFLRVGVKGKSARRLASDILQNFGGLRGLYAAGDEELREIKGLGTAKIAQIRAVIELGKRCLQEQLPQGNLLDSPASLLDYLAQDMCHLSCEVFRVLLLDNRYRLIHDRELFRGGVGSSTVYPGEVVKLALRCRARALIFAHNHINGDSKPSEDDYLVTRRLVWACQLVGVRVLDHFIVGNPYFSFAEEGLIERYSEAGEAYLAKKGPLSEGGQSL